MTPSQRIASHVIKGHEEGWFESGVPQPCTDPMLMKILDEMDARISRLENKGLPENISLNHD